MSETHEGRPHAESYEVLKRDVDSRFPAGHFVAIEAGEVVADASSHRELVQKLKEMGKSPKDMLVLEAGVEYPESAVILLNNRGRGGDA